MRRWIDLTNKVQRGGTREVSLERAEEKNSVDRLDPVSWENGDPQNRGPHPHFTGNMGTLSRK